MKRSVFSLIVLLLASLSFAETIEVNVSASQTKETAYVANALLKVSGEKKDFITLFLMDYATSVSASDPSIDAKTLASNLQWMEKTLRDNQRLANGEIGLQTYSEVHRKALNLLLELGHLSIPIPVSMLVSSVEFGLAAYDYVQEPIARNTALEKLNAMERDYRPMAAWVIQRYHARAQTNPLLKQIDDSLISSRFGASVTDSAYEIVAQNPEFKQDRILEALFENIRPGGDLDHQFKNLADLTTAQSERILESVKTNRNALAYLVQFVSDEKALQKEAIEQEKKLLEERQKLMGVNASIYALSSLLGLKDPKAGRALQATWQSAVTINEAFKSFHQGAINFGSFQASAILTGNIIGAFTSLIGIFGESQEVAMLREVLRQIEELSNQVESFRQEMRQYFIHIDGRLDGLYNELQSATRQISAQSKINANTLNAIQMDLISLSHQVSDLDLNIRTYLTQSKAEEIRKLEMQCMQSSQRGAVLDYEHFVSCLNQLEVCAVKTSTGSTLAGIPGDFLYGNGLDLPAIGSKLGTAIQKDYRLWQSNWLDAFIVPVQEALAVLGVNGTSGKLPNASVWGSCAKNYSEVIFENLPYFQYAHQGEGLQAIKEVGTRTRNFRISLQNQAQSVYEKIIDEYRESVAELNETVKYSRKSTESTSLKKYSINAGPDQPLLVKPAHLFEATISKCREYKMHSGLADADHPVSFDLTESQREKLYEGIKNRFKIAHDLQEASLNVCIESIEWANISYKEINRKLHRTSLPNRPRPLVAADFTEVFQELSGQVGVVIRKTMTPNGGQEYIVGKDKYLVGPITVFGARSIVDGSSALRWQREDVSLHQTFTALSAKVAEAVSSGRGSSLVAATDIEATELEAAKILQALFSDTSKSFSSSIKHSAYYTKELEKVSGARALLLAAVTIGLPHSLKNDDELRSSFYGANSLFTGDELRDLIPSEATNDNPNWLKLAELRIQQLADQLKRVNANKNINLESDLQLDSLNANLIALELERNRSIKNIDEVYTDLTARVDELLSSP